MKLHPCLEDEASRSDFEMKIIQIKLVKNRTGFKAQDVSFKMRPQGEADRRSLKMRLQGDFRHKMALARASLDDPPWS